MGLCYGLGIAFGVIVATPTSGGHLSPCFTLAFWMFKGFPARKVPFYIFAQILGAYVACLVVYWQYRQQFVAITGAFVAGGKGAAVFSPAGVRSARSEQPRRLTRQRLTLLLFLRSPPESWRSSRARLRLPATCS